MLVSRFRVNIEQHVLDDLQLRLKQARFARFTGSGGWDYGTSTEFLEEFVGYWRDQFDWRHQEMLLNRLTQYKARLHGNDIHFVHERGVGKNSIPLLLLHGWPDSFYRYHKVIPMLSDPTAINGVVPESFDVVVPSLPGFGFTGRVKFEDEKQPLKNSADLIWELMTQTLGYERFCVAGGDVGRTVGEALAIHHPESVIGLHLTDLSSEALTVDPSLLTKPELKYLDVMKEWALTDGAYEAIQSTKPRSVAPALNDSPVGLASWLLDRFYAWSDNNGNIYNSFTKDELLTNIMLYWVTNTIDSSMFLYYAETEWSSLGETAYVERPVGMSLFPKDIGGVPPRQLAERSLNIQHWKVMPHGGHFAPWEVPELYVNELRQFFGQLNAAERTASSEQTSDAVKAKTGTH